ncbi:hypothetical protein L1887_28668 [Cichorium endivia]|nr:hypothetical protein L1887_28668 [Cichorium endivia]
MAALGDGGSNRRLLQATFSGEQQPSPASLGSVAIRDQNKQEGYYDFGHRSGDSPTMAALGDGGSNRRLLQAAFSGEQQPSPASLGSVAIRDQNKQEG